MTLFIAPLLIGLYVTVNCTLQTVVNIAAFTVNKGRISFPWYFTLIYALSICTVICSIVWLTRV